MFFQKDVHCLKNTLLSCPYFVERTSIFSKTLYSHVIFLTFTWKTPCCHVYIWSKNRQFCQNYLYYGSKKSIGCSFFFPIFYGKITSLMPIFCQENVHSQKNTMLWSSYFIKKRPVFQKHCALMSVFQNFHENSLLSSPYLVKKTSILSKLHYIMNKSKRRPFFTDISQKIIARMPIFCQKTSIL